MLMAGEFSEKLALAVRNIQWSYAIFWSISPRHPGVLEWGDGFYNGDIKTRKTILAMDANTELPNNQRSEQLRELYHFLSVGEACLKGHRPSASLSPEDLSDMEWYYMVCMSFLFGVDQGLPSVALAKGHPIWLCNASYADNSVFSRSLLAKSASIQTIVCLPFEEGVVELGVTDMVMKDSKMINYVQNMLLEILSPLRVKNTSSEVEFLYPSINGDVTSASPDPSFLVFEDEDAYSDCISPSIIDNPHVIDECSGKVGEEDDKNMDAFQAMSSSGSSFVSWNEAGSSSGFKSKTGTPQRLLKKILTAVPHMHKNNHHEKRQFAKVDDTINYLQLLERRIEDLESCLDKEVKSSPAEIAKIKRKCRHRCEGGSTVNVVASGGEVEIEMECWWREGILVEIMDAVSRCGLDSHSVRSSTIDGAVFIAISSRAKKKSGASAEAIKEALQKVAINE